MPYSSMYQPIPFTDLREPGVLRGSPFSSFRTFPDSLPPSLAILPASLISNAIALALLEEVELRFMLYAIRKSLAPIAVAPVTNWRYYDTIYTERFMQAPQENVSGYDDNSPVNHADKLQGELLFLHGTLLISRRWLCHHVIAYFNFM